MKYLEVVFFFGSKTCTGGQLNVQHSLVIDDLCKKKTSCYLPTTVHKTPTNGIQAPSRIFAGCELVLLGELVRELTLQGWGIPLALEHDGLVIITDYPSKILEHNQSCLSGDATWRCEKAGFELYGHRPQLKCEVVAKPMLE